MRSYMDEMEALSLLITQKAEQGDAVLAPGQKDSLKALGVPDSITKDFKQWDPEDKPDMAVCMLYRGKVYLSGNQLGMCVDCGEMVQWSPQLTSIPDELKPICVFCVIERDRKRSDE